MYLNICRLLTRTCVRQIHTSVSRNLMKDHSDNTFRKKLRSTAFYWSGVGVLSYSYGGTLSAGHDASKVSTMTPIRNRKIKIMFNADVASSMQWNFKPQQKEITIIPGETALAFYTATNPTDNQIVGISTYNVLPFEVGQYFNKIQCFCFEEQMLNPHEQVDMPVFFFIDPEFIEDPKMEFVNEIVLSYTFFEAKPGFNLPVPSYAKSHLTK
ncbi:PREDICTED: cytochrome c oxidase assembly protein COX11, mitochondrial isoform X2 [Acromyrmex echinatior]|uniref:cytochrome c oxidase assembly protein COX11, mitochondrial isoform X2 n=1 Tax=Acromyrmex echinatior TaxID=103372 RepID=UPI000580CE07|nr:PREDICTED: cytochrome c oxidase assembly protein COX11, mitochondrial isoform X2 [Acromyrmex echinatior]